MLTLCFHFCVASLICYLTLVGIDLPFPFFSYSRFFLPPLYHSHIHLLMWSKLLCSHCELCGDGHWWVSPPPQDPHLKSSPTCFGRLRMRAGEGEENLDRENSGSHSYHRLPTDREHPAILRQRPVHSLTGRPDSGPCSAQKSLPQETEG